MQTNNRIFDDIAKVASGAASTLAGLKDEIDSLVRSQMERVLSDLAVVTREEFEAVKQTAANARTEQENLKSGLLHWRLSSPRRIHPPAAPASRQLRTRIARGRRTDFSISGRVFCGTGRRLIVHKKFQSRIHSQLARWVVFCHPIFWYTIETKTSTCRSLHNMLK